MRDLDDFDLRRGDPVTDPPSDAEIAPDWMQPSRPRGSRPAAALIALLLVGGALVALWMMSRRVEPPAPGTSTHVEATAENAPVTGDEPLRRSPELDAPVPPLEQSDALVRRLAGELSSHPALRAWLATPRLVRTFAASVENASLGASPSPNLTFLRPREPYRAVERTGPNGTELVPDPASYQRYDAITEVFTSIDPQAAAGVYRRLHGLVQEAYAELGYPDQSFDAALAQAFESLLQTPIPATAPLLERHVNTYRYADPRLEELTPLQKHLLRMGPDHAARVKGQIRALATELELGVD
jgi:hypothetical protein